MSIKLTDTQLVLLSAASQRDDHCLVPPTGARVSPTRKAAAKLLDAGLVKEIRARKDMPVWRRDEDTDQAIALKLTAAALKAIAADANEDTGDALPTDDDSEETNTELRVVESQEVTPVHRTAAAGVRPSQPIVPRAGTKIRQVIVALEEGSGATIDEIMTATGWLPHTTRAALAGLRKRGYTIEADRSDRTRGSVYRIARTDGDAGASSTGAASGEGAAADRGPAAGAKPERTALKSGPRTRKAA